MQQDYKPSAGTHPITPPPELVEQWLKWLNSEEGQMCDDWVAWVAVEAAQWGADQELEACCEWLEKNTDYHITIEFLRDARRPKPPSLKERALAVLDDCTNCLDGAHENTIRRALEQLPDAL